VLGRIKTSLAILLVWLALEGASTQLLHAQQSANRPTILQHGDIADIPGREVVTAILELPPNGAAGRHSHPGTEIGYVLEGSATLIIEGQAAREVKAGDSWIIGAGIRTRVEPGQPESRFSALSSSRKASPWRSQRSNQETRR